MSCFTVTHLPEARFHEALPLVRMAAPFTTAQSWREFVRTLFAGTGGILAAIAADGRPHGIAAYWRDQTLFHGTVLRVEPLVTFEVSRNAPARAALCEALEDLARAKACKAIIISTASRGYAEEGRKMAGWRSLGFEMAAVDLVKWLVPAIPSVSDGAPRLETCTAQSA